jgi:uncharacterized membrane protein
MNHQHVHRKDTASTFTASKLPDIFFIIMYTYYYIHMVILSVLGSSPNMLVAMSGMVWLKRTMLIANLITFIFCIYHLIKNKQMAIWCMDHMPRWMYRLMGHMPKWTYRFMNHNSMRIMMTLCDVMLAWMCVEFGHYTLDKFGW